MEVGIEDCLHIEFEFDKQKYHLKVRADGGGIGQRRAKQGCIINSNSLENPHSLCLWPYENTHFLLSPILNFFVFISCAALHNVRALF